MNRLVERMRAELRGILHDAVLDYPRKRRDKWLFDWPSQIILVGGRRGQQGGGDGQPPAVAGAECRRSH